mgnify:CR=1 FL=1
MDNGKRVGMALFVAGIVLLVAYGLYLGFDELVQALDVITGFFIALMLLGFVILMASIVIEQRRDTKKMKEEIDKEDLEP